MNHLRTTLIRGGTVVLGNTISKLDLLIQGERISAVGDLSEKKTNNIVDAEGLLVLPGAIDSHVHFNDVFMNTISVHDYYTGTLAAAYGGVTSVIDFANQAPGERLVDTLVRKKAEENSLSLVDWGVHPVITEPTPETLDEIPTMVAEGAPTIKCYMTYRDEGLMLEVNDLIKVSTRLRDSGGMLMVHAEDNDLLEKTIAETLKAGLLDPYYHAVSRPIEVENKAIEDCVRVVRETGGRLFIVHLASGDGMEIISSARAGGLEIIAETCTHYLLFTDEILKREDGFKWICSPALRDQNNQDRLWEGIVDGRISMVTSDDAAYMWEAKLYGLDGFDKCPNGMPGIEPRLNLLYSEGVDQGRISLTRLVELISSTPAKLFGLWPQKGNLMPGADADIVLFDPTANWIMGQETLHMATDYSSYEDIEITGKIMQVYSRGELIVDGEQCLAERGRGRYLHRKLDLSIRASI